ncbi:MAG: GTPase ObgE [Vicinamibacteria bacterium]
MFVDEVDIVAVAGDGGNGCMSFRREKFVPRGGPDGGNGGWGGSIYLTAAPNLNTLVNFRYHPEFKARRGGNGEGSNRTGRSGQDLDIQVPAGTVATAVDEHGERRVVADLIYDGDRVLVARGGRGGRGNAVFVSSINQAPRRSDPGEPGDVVSLHLHLKLLADVGLIGYPNAGKSTLISVISAAKPKIADYPFTTLVPNLGVVDMGDDRSFVVADVPGLIEGAHTGAGLGHRFLGHVERSAVLIHLVDVSSLSGRDPVEDFEIIRRELALYEPDSGADLGHTPIAERVQIVAPSKLDALDEPERLEKLVRHVESLGMPCFPISAVTREGVSALLEAVWPHVKASKAAAATARQAAQQALLANPEPGPRSHAAGQAAADRRAAQE